LQTIKQPKTLFPLALNDDETNQIGQIFDWAPEKSPTNPYQENHHIFVLQLRDAMISSLSHELVQLVSKANQEFNNLLKNYLLANVEELHEDILSDRALLRQIATGELQAEGATSEGLEFLKELTSIESPL
jgi:hypothetical protein